MDRKPILIFLAAMEMERRAIARGIGWNHPNRRGQTHLHAPVQLHLIGIGGGRLPHIAPPAVVVMAGFAGALDPSLRVGDIIFEGPDEMLPPGVNWRRGLIHTAERLIATAANKATLFKETGALAVEMEQAAVRRALPADVQLIGLRVISDSADMPVNPVLITLIDSRGRLRPLRLIAAVSRRPKFVCELVQLARSSRQAARSLEAACRNFMSGFDAA